MNQTQKIIKKYKDLGIITESPLTWQDVNGMVIAIITIITIVFGICFAMLII